MRSDLSLSHGCELGVVLTKCRIVLQRGRGSPVNDCTLVITTGKGIGNQLLTSMQLSAASRIRNNITMGWEVPEESADAHPC